MKTLYDLDHLAELGFYDHYRQSDSPYDLNNHRIRHRNRHNGTSRLKRKAVKHAVQNKY